MSILQHCVNMIHHDDCPMKHNIKYIFSNCLLYPQCKTIKQIDAEYKNIMNETRSIFITINFGKKTHKEILSLIHIFETSNILTNIPAAYCFEFYNENCDPHFHIHTLQKLGDERVRRKRIIQKCAKLFNLEENFVDYKFSNKLDRYITWLNYIEGIKDHKKQAAHQLDIIKREELKLKPFYIL